MRAAVLLSLILPLFCSCAGEGKKNGSTDEPKVIIQRKANIAHFGVLVKRNKKPFGVAAKSFGISKSPQLSLNYLTITGNVPPHIHKDHDEVFVLVQGSGVFYVQSPDGGIQSHEVAEGSIIHIPKGTAHAYQHLAGPEAPSNGISFFAPIYDTDDRHFVDWPKGSIPEEMRALVESLKEQQKNKNKKKP